MYKGKQCVCVGGGGGGGENVCGRNSVCVKGQCVCDRVGGSISCNYQTEGLTSNI